MSNFSYKTPASPDTSALTGSTSTNSLGSLFTATTTGVQTVSAVISTILSDNKKIAFEPYNNQFTLSDGTTGYSALHYATKVETEGLNGLGDVTINSIADNQLLAYDSNVSKFVNAKLAFDNIASGVVLDSDEMSGTSATTLATSESIKAYVDSQVTAQDLDFQGDTGGAQSIDLDSEILTLTGGTGINTTGSSQTMTFAIDNTVVQKDATQTLTAKTLTTPVIASLQQASGSNTLTMPAATDTLIGKATTDNLTNKSIDADNNTISNLEVDNLKSGVLDTDLNSASSNDDTLASAKAIKAYVDAHPGDITGVAAGNGLTGGGTSGDVTLSAVGTSNRILVSGAGIDIDSNYAGQTSITTLGTITTGVWNGTAIANSNLANSSVNYGGVTLSLGGSDTTPAFDLTDATNYPTSSLSGTITNAQLAGSIANAKLANFTVSYGGISLALGASDATPAFDLADATNYPTSSLTGTITNAQLAGSIANAKLANSSITVTDGSSSTATSLGGTITFSGTTNEVEVGESSGTITVGLPNNVTIAGNLTVNGTTTTVATDNIIVKDSLISLAKDNNGSDSLDIGFYGLYDTSGSQDLYAGLFRDANDSGKFKLFKDLQVEPTTTVNTSAGSYATGTLVASLEGNVTGNVSGTSGSTTGNAATATALANARTIGGTSFDGTANIAVALSATATALANARNIGGVSFDGTANINLPGVNTSGNQDTSGNAATATAFATAREINGTSFDGTANITVTAAAGTLTGSTLNSGVTASSLTSVGTIATGVWNGTAIADAYISSASTWNAKQNALTFGIANTNAVKIDDADAANNDYARLTASGIEGRSYSEVISDIGAIDTAGTGLTKSSSTLSVNASQTQITAVGTLSTGTWSATDIAIAHGGTGSSTASGARTNLGLGTAAVLNSVDEDNMASNSATLLPTQQSVKAYVDANAGGGGMPTTGGTFTGDVTFTGDNYDVVWDKSENALVFEQDAILRLGSNFEIENHANGNTGIGQIDADLYITSKANDKSVFIYGDDGTSSISTVKYFQADGASGEAQLYHYGSQKLATKSTGVKVTGELDFGNSSNNDVSLIRTGNDATSFGFNLKYLGSGTGVNNSLAIFTDNQNGGEASLQALTIRQDGHVGILNTSPTYELSVTGDIYVSDDIIVGDNIALLSDASIIHFGSDSDTFLTHVHNTGLLLNSTRQLQFGDSGTYIHQSADGVLDLVSDTEIELNATTIDINGAVDINSTTTLNDDVTFTGASYNAVWDKSDNALEFADDAKVTFGTGADLTIRHDSSNNSTYIEESGSGHLLIKGDDVVIQNAAGSKNLARFNDGGAVQLFQPNSNTVRFQTATSGVSVIGNLETTADIELGHASDTTLSRVSAGVIAVEGKNLSTVDDATALAIALG